MTFSDVSDQDNEFKKFDPYFLVAAHGMRTIDVLKKWCKITDPELLASEVVRFETAILNAAEDIGKSSGKSGIEVLPGVAKLLADLGAEADKRGGEEKWAICTSCMCTCAWLTFCKLIWS